MKVEEAKSLIMAEVADLKTSTWFSGKVQRKALHWGLRSVIPQKDGGTFTMALRSLAEEGRIVVKTTNRETWISLP